MHDDVLLINFTTKPRIQNANVVQRIEIAKNTSMEGERIVQIVRGSEAWWGNGSAKRHRAQGLLKVTDKQVAL